MPLGSQLGCCRKSKKVKKEAEDGEAEAKTGTNKQLPGSSFRTQESKSPQQRNETNKVSNRCTKRPPTTPATQEVIKQPSERPHCLLAYTICSWLFTPSDMQISSPQGFRLKELTKCSKSSRTRGSTLQAAALSPRGLMVFFLRICCYLRLLKEERV